MLFIFSLCKCLLNISEILRDFVGCSFLFIACGFSAHHFHFNGEGLESGNNLMEYRQQRPPLPPTLLPQAPHHAPAWKGQANKL